MTHLTQKDIDDTLNVKIQPATPTVVSVSGAMKAWKSTALHLAELAVGGFLVFLVYHFFNITNPAELISMFGVFAGVAKYVRANPNIPTYDYVNQPKESTIIPETPNVSDPSSDTSGMA